MQHAIHSKIYNCVHGLDYNYINMKIYTFEYGKLCPIVLHSYLEIYYTGCHKRVKIFRLLQVFEWFYENIVFHIHVHLKSIVF